MTFFVFLGEAVAEDNIFHVMIRALCNIHIPHAESIFLRIANVKDESHSGYSGQTIEGILRFFQGGGGHEPARRGSLAGQKVQR